MKKDKKTMKLFDLNASQRLELKKRLLTEAYVKAGDTPADYELDMADTLVSDLELMQRYEDTRFSADDFKEGRLSDVSVCEGWTMYSHIHNCYFGRASRDDYQSYFEPFAWEVRDVLTKTKEEIIKIFEECEDPFYGGKHSWGFEPIHLKIELTRTM